METSSQESDNYPDTGGRDVASATPSAAHQSATLWRRHGR
jgi:hypothetical protein